MTGGVPRRRIVGHPRFGAAGFTLMEILVVVVLLGLVLAIVVGAMPRRGGGVDLAGAAGDLAGALRLARARAIAFGRPVVAPTPGGGLRWSGESAGCRPGRTRAGRAGGDRLRAGGQCHRRHAAAGRRRPRDAAAGGLADRPRRHRRGPLQMRQARGFTLLEVLIAFVIAALALAVLFRGGIDGLLAARIAGRSEEAVARAQSRLTALCHGTRLAPGTQAGDDGGGFAWRTEVLLAETACLPRGGGDDPSRPAATLFAVG